MSDQFIQSHWGAELKGRFTSQQSNKLCIVLPGIAYLLDRSYLDYSKQLAVELGYDVLEVEYGFQVSRSAFDVPTEFDIMVEETLRVIDKHIKESYKHVLVIGKSIGTAVQIKVNEHLKEREVHNIAISPIDKTAHMGVLPNTLVVTSLSDPLLSPEALDKIDASGIEVVLIEGANHALDIAGDVIQTVSQLERVLQKEKEFIQNLA
ncbi:MAG: hypothetical protein ACRCTE_01570 [Cellulosilyticaceae bacterium]